MGFLQHQHARASPALKAHAVLAAAAENFHSKPLALITYPLRSKIKLGAKAGAKVQNFGAIMTMIDNMVGILGQEQGEDDKQKGYCEAEFDKSGR